MVSLLAGKMWMSSVQVVLILCTWKTWIQAAEPTKEHYLPLKVIKGSNPEDVTCGSSVRHYNIKELTAAGTMSQQPDTKPCECYLQIGIHDNITVQVFERPKAKALYIQPEQWGTIQDQPKHKWLFINFTQQKVIFKHNSTASRIIVEKIRDTVYSLFLIMELPGSQGSPVMLYCSGTGNLDAVVFSSDSMLSSANMKKIFIPVAIGVAVLLLIILYCCCKHRQGRKESDDYFEAENIEDNTSLKDTNMNTSQHDGGPITKTKPSKRGHHPAGLKRIVSEPSPSAPAEEEATMNGKNCYSIIAQVHNV